MYEDMLMITMVGKQKEQLVGRMQIVCPTLRSHKHTNLVKMSTGVEAVRNTFPGAVAWVDIFEIHELRIMIDIKFKSHFINFRGIMIDKNPLHNAFIEAGQQAGYPFTDDMNGYQQEGFG